MRFKGSREDPASQRCRKTQLARARECAREENLLKTLRKYLATPALAFFLAFAVAGTPNAPATVIVPSSGQAEAARAVGVAIGIGIAASAMWDGIKAAAGWLAGLPWANGVSRTTAAQGELVRSGQGHLLVLDVHSTSTLYSSCH